MSQADRFKKQHPPDPLAVGPEDETLSLSITRDYGTSGPSPGAPPPLRDGSRFQVRQFHAKGGLGMVHVAEDLELQRSVAFKQIQPMRADNPDSRRRFLLEAEITAKLEHPGVVPVYGLVAGDRGEPAYAMRFLRGGTFAEAIREFHAPSWESPPAKPTSASPTAPTEEIASGPPFPEMTSAKRTAATPSVADDAFRSVKFRQLLSHFVAFCNTIAFAHSRGIIHRDIKPDNLMLGAYGESLVVDWGLARPYDLRTGIDPQEIIRAEAATDAPLRPVLSSSEAEQTAMGAAVGTPAYMAPEQAEGRWDIVGPTADIYSLGATLYALLTGTRPFAAKDLQAVLQAVREGHFTPPREVNPQIPRPLAAICTKAMSLESRARYTSALDLAKDIEQYLADEPVTAYREGIVERARRFGRKHRTVVTSAAATVLVGLIALGVATILLTAANQRERQARQQADDQRDRADANLQRAKDAVEKYLTEVANDRQLKQDDFHELRKRLLQTAVPFYEEFSRQQEHEPERRADVGRAYRRLAFIQSETGERELALANLERMRDLFAPLANEFPNVPEYRQELATSHNNLGKSLGDLGKHIEAERAHSRGLEIREQLVAQFPSVPEYLHDVSASHDNLGTLLTELGNRKEAEKAYSRALGFREQLVAQFPNVPEYLHDLAHSHNNLGMLLSELGRYVEAEKAFSRAIEIREQLSAQFPNLPESRRDLADSYNNLGILLTDLGKGVKAEKAWSRVLEIRKELAAQFPSVPAYHKDLADCHYNLGLLLQDLRKHVEAEKACSRGLEIRQELAALFPNVPEYRKNLANSHNSLGLSLMELGKRKEAEEAYSRAIEILDQLATQFPNVPEYRIHLAGSCVNLAFLIRNPSRANEALDWFKKAITPLEGVLKTDGRLEVARQFLRNAYLGRAPLLMQLARFNEAAADWQRASELDDGKLRSAFRMQRALCLAHVDSTKAVAEAEELASDDSVSAAMLHDAARVCSLAAANSQDASDREKYSVRAIEFLRQAVAHGFRDVAQINRDKDLAPLRERAEFGKLIAELEAAAAKKPAGKP